MYLSADIRPTFDAGLAKAFVKTLELTLRLLQDVFPNCGATRELVLKTKALVSNSEQKELQALDAFHNQMCKDAGSFIPYAPAVRRLTGEDTTLYVVAAYKDGKFFSNDLVPEMLHTLNLQEKFADPAVTLPIKTELWSRIHTMITLAKLKHNLPTETKLPTSDEIAANIRAHRESDGTTSQLLQTAIQLLMSALQSYVDKMPLSETDDLDAKNAIAEVLAKTKNDDNANAFREHFMMHIDSLIEPDGYSFAAAVEKKEISKFVACPVDIFVACKLKERLEFTSLQDTSDVQFLLDAVQQCTSCFSVHKSLPKRLLNTIESRARQIERAMQSGDPTSSVNVAQIGMDVMKDCDPEDVQALVNNMKDLIPQLGTLAGSIPKTDNMPDVQQMMKSLSYLAHTQ